MTNSIFRNSFTFYNRISLNIVYRSKRICIISRKRSEKFAKSMASVLLLMHPLEVLDVSNCTRNAECKLVYFCLWSYSPSHSVTIFPAESFNFDHIYSTYEIPSILDDPTVVTIAKKYGKTSSQILLRFLIQNNVIVIPKSTNPSRLRQNLDVSIYL